MFAAHDLEKKIRVAVKMDRTKIQGQQNTNEALLLREGELMQNLNHPNIIQILHINSGDIFLVMPLMDESLDEHIYANDRTYDKEDAKTIMRQLLTGLKYLDEERSLQK